MSFGSLPSVLGNGGGVAISVIGGTGLFADGTAAAPSISFAADTDTGFYRNASNSVALSNGGFISLRFINSGGGIIQNGNNAASLSLLDTGAVGLTAAGTNQNITLTPSGTGKVSFENANTKWFFGEQSAGFGYLHILPSATSPTTANYTLLNDGAGNLYVNTVSAAGVIVFRQNAAEVAQFNPSKRFLLGTATDSGALLQVGANAATGAALAGMSFGGDTFLSRRAAGELEILSPSGAEALLSLSQNGTQRGYIRTNGGAVEFRSTTVNPLILSTNNLTALTLDSSQNATFAGTVKPQLATTAGAPAYVKGAIYFDTTLNKLRVGGATAWETITSV